MVRAGIVGPLVTDSRMSLGGGEGRTDLQLLHPVLTFGLLVLARRCLGSSPVDFMGVVDDTEGGGEVGPLCRWWLATSADMVGF